MLFSGGAAAEKANRRSVKMDSHITNQLGPGEEIVWTGSPQPFSAKSGGYAKALTKRILICAAVAVILVIAYILAAKATSTSVGIAGIIICILVPGYIALNPYLDARRLQKKAQYAVSNTRLFVMPDEKHLYTMDLDGIRHIQYVAAENGCGHIVVSTDPALSAADLKLRKIAISPVLPDDAAAGATMANAKTAVLYNLKDPEEAVACLRTAK